MMPRGQKHLFAGVSHQQSQAATKTSFMAGHINRWFDGGDMTVSETLPGWSMAIPSLLHGHWGGWQKRKTIKQSDGGDAPSLMLILTLNPLWPGAKIVDFRRLLKSWPVKRVSQSFHQIASKVVVLYYFRVCYSLFLLPGYWLAPPAGAADFGPQAAIEMNPALFLPTHWGTNQPSCL